MEAAFRRKASWRVGIQGRSLEKARGPLGDVRGAAKCSEGSPGPLTAKGAVSPIQDQASPGALGGIGLQRAAEHRVVTSASTLADCTVREADLWGHHIVAF